MKIDAVEFEQMLETSVQIGDELDLLSKMLVYDHAERITPKEAMLHPYFAELNERFAKEGNPSLANLKKKIV